MKEIMQLKIRTTKILNNKIHLKNYQKNYKIQTKLERI